MKLEILWECTISDIEAACNARTSKSIPFLESPCVIHDDEFPANRQMSPPGKRKTPEMNDHLHNFTLYLGKLNLTHLNVCEHDGKILGALSTGEVFTMVYDAFTTTQKITDKNGEASEIQLMNRSFVISQLLKVKAVKLVSKAIVTRNEDGNEDVPVAGVATTSGKSTFTAVQFEDEEDEVQVN